LGSFAFAQNTEYPPPRTPVLQKAPVRAEWTVEISYEPEKAVEKFTSDKADAEGLEEEPEVKIFRPTQIRVSKDGNTYREVTTWSNGKKSEKWIVDGLQIRELPRSGRLSRIDLTSYSEHFSDYRRSDFEPVEWVGLDNYVGAKKLKGRQVYEFRSTANKKRLTAREQFFAEDGVPNSGDTVAYLDAKTQLPIFVINGHTARIYKDFSPGAPLTLPKRFADEFNKWKQFLLKKSRPPTPS
ncbi:MAG: hypothetical protein ACK5NG_06535, partial [Chthoniobacterales bacterium]